MSSTVSPREGKEAGKIENDREEEDYVKECESIENSSLGPVRTVQVGFDEGNGSSKGDEMERAEVDPDGDLEYWSRRLYKGEDRPMMSL